MPLGDPTRLLTLLAFPQSWAPNALTVRFLCLPKGDPQQPLRLGLPKFADANLVFEASVIRGLEQLPRTMDSVGLGELVVDEAPVNKTALFAELAQEFNIVPRVPPPAGAPLPRFRKPVTESYLSLTGRRQLSKYLTNEKDFECALHDAHTSQPAAPAVLSNAVTWGRLLSFALRQPKLAMALGIVGQATIPIPDPTVFDTGGWLFIGIHATSDYAAAAPRLDASYAARIPPLNGPRSLYAAVLFPVDGLGGVADDADVFREASRYDLGFARMVHGAQSDGQGDSIQLGWDDEQVADWLNRQVDPKNEAPMGTSGYRVDVREPGGAWNSLLKIESDGDLMLGPVVLGGYSGESIVEVMPAQVAPARAGDFWMPHYFTTWRGSSLALTDPDLVGLHAGVLPDHPETAPLLLNREKTFLPVDDKLVKLRYGKTYEFRVRLADLTRGGPPPSDDTPAVPHATTTINFQRRSRPGQIIVMQRPKPTDKSIKIAKPRLGYPEALFAGVTFNKLKADVPVAGAQKREISVADPDVVRVEVTVAVRALEGDVAAFQPLYTTTRKFNAEQLTLKLQLEDHSTLDSLAAVQPSTGPLKIPTARDIRLTLVAIGRDDPGYFAAADPEREFPDPRRGLLTTLDLRAPAEVEEPLFAPVDTPLCSFFFQPPPADGSVASPAQRVAQELGLDHTALTLAGRPGHRTVIGCSANLRHTLSPERAAITIASEADVIQHWINVLRFTLARDWTWDGLAEEGIAVQRRIVRPGLPDVTQLAGTIRLPHSLAATATSGVAADPRNAVRQTTDILFFDSFDPKPKPGEFPTETTIEYEITAAFKGDVPDPDPETLTNQLPIVTPPVQVPKLVSAGIALSQYEAADDYSSTEQRRRRLWLELELPPLDKDDAYFVRVLANAPDPMLTDEDIPEVVEPPLPIEPEWMRLILPNQPRDHSGSRAMDILDQQAEDGRHYVVSLPKGMKETSLELLGMFTYEIRVGHTDARWCTAQSRYGPPLRIAGVQHPPAPLVCQAARTRDAIRVRAPFATPVHNGRNVRPQFPKTHLWGVLYARVRQTDGASWRNLLLARTRLFPPQSRAETDALVLFGEGRFPLVEIDGLLRRLGLPDDAPLTTLAVELFTDPIGPDPLGRELGHARMLRVSPLIPVPDAC
jgi:hypothetical protein